MTIGRYDPFDSLVRWQRDMGRLFGNGLRAVDSDFASGERRWTPAIDIREDSGSFVIRADLPGVQRDDVEITMDHDVLTIRGKREAAQSSEGGTAAAQRAHQRHLPPPVHPAGNRQPGRHRGEVRQRRAGGGAAQGHRSPSPARSPWQAEPHTVIGAGTRAAAYSAAARRPAPTPLRLAMRFAAPLEFDHGVRVCVVNVLPAVRYRCIRLPNRFCRRPAAL